MAKKTPKDKKLRTHPLIRQSTHRSPVTLLSGAPCEVANYSYGGGGIVIDSNARSSPEDGGTFARQQ
jgi:hypothetical protein